MPDAVDILSKRGLKRTNGRIRILEIFLANEGMGLSESDIENRMAGSLDRVTIYRTLSTFQDKHLLHRIADDEGVIRYALCQPNCSHQHVHDHVHFKCSNCKKTECLSNDLTAEISLPSGYIITETNFLVVGLCADCN